MSKKSLFTIVLSLFAAMCLAVGVMFLMPKNKTVNADVTPSEYFYDFEDGVNPMSGGMSIKTLAGGNKVLASTGGWQKSWTSFKLETLGSNWEVSFDVHVGATASSANGSIRIGLLSPESSGSANFDGSRYTNYFTSTGFSCSKVISTDVCKKDGVEHDYAMTFRYMGGCIYIKVDNTWLSSTVETGKANDVSSGYLCFQFEYNGEDYIDNLYIKSIEASKTQAFAENTTSVWGTLRKNYYKDANGNIIKDGNVRYDVDTADKVVKYNTELTGNFRMSFDIDTTAGATTSANNGMRLAWFSNGTSDDNSYTRLLMTMGNARLYVRRNGTGTSYTDYKVDGNSYHFDVYHINGVINFAINGVFCGDGFAVDRTYTGWFQVRLAPNIFIGNIDIELNPTDVDSMGMSNKPASGETANWLDGYVARWASTELVYDTAKMVEKASGDNVVVGFESGSWQRALFARTYDSTKKVNAYKFDETKNYRVQFDVNLPVASKQTRIGFFMREINNPDEKYTGLGIFITKCEQVEGGYKVSYSVKAGSANGSSFPALSTSTITIPTTALSVDFIYYYSNSKGYMCLNLGGQNIVTGREFDLTNGGVDANGVTVDRRYLGFQVEDISTTFDNFSITDNYVIDPNANMVDLFEGQGGASAGAVVMRGDGTFAYHVTSWNYAPVQSKAELPAGNFKMSFDYLPTYRAPDEDPEAVTLNNFDGFRFGLLADYVSGWENASSFVLRIGATRSSWNTGKGFTNFWGTSLKSDGQKYHIEFTCIDDHVTLKVDGVTYIKDCEITRTGTHYVFQSRMDQYIQNINIEELTGKVVKLEVAGYGEVTNNGTPMQAGYYLFDAGSSMSLTFTATNDSFVNAIYVNDTESKVDGTTSFSYQIASLDNDAVIKVVFGARETVSENLVVTYDANSTISGGVITEGINSWKENAFDYGNIKKVVFDSNYGLGNISGSTYGFVTYKIQTPTVAGATVTGLKVTGRNKVSKWGSANCYIDYYIGAEDGRTNNYANYTLKYSAPLGSGMSDYNTALSFVIDDPEEITYIQMRVLSNDNWIIAREIGFEFVYEINDDFSIDYDSYTSGTGWLEGSVDSKNMQIVPFDTTQAVGPGSNKTGYITYKIVTDGDKKLDSVHINLRGKLSNWSGASTAASCYVDYYIGYADGRTNNYADFTKYHSATIGTDQTYYNKTDEFDIEGDVIEGKSVIYLQIRVGSANANWILIRGLTISDIEYQKAQVTFNYGTSYTTYNYDQYVGLTLDQTVIDIKSGYVRLDQKIYSDSTFETEFDATTVISGNTTLYIKVANGLITYNLNGGTNNPANKSYYESANGPVTLQDPTKTDWTFGGWYYDSEFQNAFTAIAQGATGDVEVYAKFTQAPTYYSITYVLNGGTQAGNPDVYFVDTGVASFNDSVKSGFTFIGWFDGDDEVTSIAPGTTGDKTLEAIFVEDYAITGASLTLGSDLTLTYYANVKEGTIIKMVFTMNGDEVRVDGELFSTEEGVNVYSFDFTRIAPQYMGDTISAELFVDNVSKDTFNNYSVLKYCQNILADSPSSELELLIGDLLEYGAMSQTYKDYKTTALVNEGITVKSTFSPVASSDMTRTENTTVAGFNIDSAGVYFDYNNNVYIKCSVGANYKITVSAEGLDETVIDADHVKSIGSGKVQAFAPDLMAVEFNKVFTFKLYSGDTLVQTATYSVKSFVYNKQGGSDATTNLAKALYNYGLSAINYIDA